MAGRHQPSHSHSHWQPGEPLPLATAVHARQPTATSDPSSTSVESWPADPSCWPELVGGAELGGAPPGGWQAQPAGPSRQPTARGSVSDEPLLAPKACAQCRSRKVKCNKNYPRCQQCITRNEPECDYGQLVPLQAQPLSPSQSDRVPGLEQRIAELENELFHLRASHSAPIPAMFAESIRLAFLSSSGDPEQLAEFLQEEQIQRSSGSTGIGIGESSIGWRLTRPALASALSLHLLTSFFSSCCAFLPAFDPWPARAGALCVNLHNLRPAERVAVAAFCAMGARASPHSALLGVKLASPEQVDNTAKIIKAGARRQQACQSLQQRALDLCHELNIDDDVSLHSFEALLVRTQMMIFNESKPTKARSCVRAAVGQFKDLQDSPSVPRHVKVELEQRYGLPLLLADAATSATLRLPTLIAAAEFEDYFRTHALPELGTDQLAAELDQIFPPYQSGAIHHDGLNQATNTLLRWLAAANRHFSRLATRTRNSMSPVLFPGAIRLLWIAVDQIHAAVRRLQHFVIEFAGVPVGCAADGCSDLHCRMYTRLDRDADDLTWLAHTLLVDRAGPWMSDGVESRALLEESDRRIRRGLKLVAFYFTLYVSSRDPHQTYHLTFQLELLPNWTSYATQRYGEQPGPDSPDLELSETELDWLENGLAVAAFYHPCAESRQQELRAGRINHEFAPAQMPGLVFPTAVEAAMRQAATGAAHSHPHSPSFATPQSQGAALPSQPQYVPAPEEYTGASAPWHPQSTSFGALGEFETDENERAWQTSQGISSGSLAPLGPGDMSQLGLIVPGASGEPRPLSSSSSQGAFSTQSRGTYRAHGPTTTPIRAPLNLPPVARGPAAGAPFTSSHVQRPAEMTQVSSAHGVLPGTALGVSPSGSILGLPKVSPPRAVQPPSYQVAGGMTAPIAQGQGAIPGPVMGIKRDENEHRIVLDKNLGIAQSERKEGRGRGRGAASAGLTGMGRGFLEGWDRDRMQMD